MKFKKLDEKTVCCMLSEEELTDNGITIEDFIQNRDKVQNFLEDIIETAKEEVGFEASGPMLSIQIMGMYPDGVMITFSEDPKDMAAVVKAGLAQAKGEFSDDEWMEPEAVPSLEKKLFQPEKQTGTGRQPAVFSFSCMDYVFEFVRNISVRSGLNSSLYKDEQTGIYYMFLEKARMSMERYHAVLATALEFGELAGATELVMAKISEHCSCMIPAKAVNTLKKIGITKK